MPAQIEPLDIGESLLNDGDLSQLPDRRLTEMGKKMEEDEAVSQSTMVSLEQFQEKTDEIERL